MEKNTTLSMKAKSKLIQSITFISIIILSIKCTNTDQKCKNFSGNNEKKQSYKNKRITKLSFINKRADFGNVPPDTLLVQTFNFINTGNNNLIINYVNPDCICTGYTLSEDTILPGDTAHINLKFDTHNKYGSQKIYTIVSANTKPKLNKLTLLANVKNK